MQNKGNTKKQKSTKLEPKKVEKIYQEIENTLIPDSCFFKKLITPSVGEDVN